MAKRFIDTDLFRKPLMRSLDAPYKALWIYLLCECDHAGVWDVELDVAQVRLGMKIDPEKALEKLRGSAMPIDGGAKWFLPEFVTFQYGTLNPSNRVHASVLSSLAKYGIDPSHLSQNKPLASPLQGAMDMDKDKDKDIQEGTERAKPKPEPKAPVPELFAAFQVGPAFTEAWLAFEAMRQAKRKPMTPQARKLIMADLAKMGEADAIRSLNNSTRAGWTDVYPPKATTSTPTERAQATIMSRHERPETIREMMLRKSAPPPPAPTKP